MDITGGEPGNVLSHAHIQAGSLRQGSGAGSVKTSGDCRFAACIPQPTGPGADAALRLGWPPAARVLPPAVIQPGASPDSQNVHRRVGQRRFHSRPIRRNCRLQPASDINAESVRPPAPAPVAAPSPRPAAPNRAVGRRGFFCRPDRSTAIVRRHPPGGETGIGRSIVAVPG